MYPFFRFAVEIARQRRAPPLALGEAHVSHHRCWPWDLDPWRELNNGRTLTFYDLGRFPLAIRNGLVRTMRAEGWGITVAGASVRFRRRVRLFDRIEMRSVLVGRDRRFIYIEQAMFRNGEATSSVLIRGAITGPDGIVPTDRVAEAMGCPDWNPPLPDWVAAWVEADAARPWPPEI